MWCNGSYEHICLRGRRFESHWSHICVLCFFNLILARRENGNEICGEGGMRKTVWGGVMGMAEHGMTAYPLPPNK
jgi:hypothetical protein